MEMCHLAENSSTSPILSVILNDLFSQSVQNVYMPTFQSLISEVYVPIKLAQCMCDSPDATCLVPSPIFTTQTDCMEAFF